MDKVKEHLTNMYDNIKYNKFEEQGEEYELLKNKADSYGIQWNCELEDREGLEQAISDYETEEKRQMQSLNWDYYANLGVN